MKEINEALSPCRLHPSMAWDIVSCVKQHQRNESGVIECDGSSQSDDYQEPFPALLSAACRQLLYQMARTIPSYEEFAAKVKARSESLQEALLQLGTVDGEYFFFVCVFSALWSHHASHNINATQKLSNAPTQSSGTTSLFRAGKMPFSKS